MEQEFSGQCLCGQVKYSVSGPFDRFYFCHCSRCKKASGTAHVANIFGKPDSLRWVTGEHLIKRFDLKEAERFSRCFCSECGSPVPLLARTGGYVIIPAGSLDEDPLVRPDGNIFWHDRAPWYDEGLAAPRFEAYPE